MLNNCTTCGKQTKEYSKLPCPKCAADLIRCKHCRQISLPYTCPSCGQNGP